MKTPWHCLWLTAFTSSTAVGVMAALRSHREGQSPWTSVNAISHIVWGDRAGSIHGPTLRHTGTGVILNFLACAFWAGFYRAGRRVLPETDPLRRAAVLGLGTSAIAYITDYYVVPRRFTPGFELTLSRESFPWIYGVLAIGLILPEWFDSRGIGGPCAVPRARPHHKHKRLF